jgi:hypothetical protein
MLDVARQRLVHQDLVGSPHRKPDAVVARLVGIQAQDPAGGRWSVGLRLHGSTDVGVARAIVERSVVRTWAMRGTLHFLDAQDVSWVIAAVASAVVARNRRRYAELQLNDDIFARSNHVIEDALTGPEPVTRAELVRQLEQAGIHAAGQRAPYLLQRASLDGITCHGSDRDGESTFVLQRAWLPHTPAIDPGDAAPELASRYFASHGPATWQDFAWWSGLPAPVVRAAHRRVEPSLSRVAIDGRELWDSGADHPASGCGSRGLLLPPFDELLLGYRDRSASLAAEDARRVNAGGGMPKATVVVDGQVVGTWRRADRPDEWVVELTLFRPLDRQERSLIEEAADQLGTFASRRVIIAAGW